MNTPYDAEIDRLNEAEGTLYDAAKVTALCRRREGYLAAIQSPKVKALRKVLTELTNEAILAGETAQGVDCLFCTITVLNHKTDGVLVESRLNGRCVRTYHEATCVIIAARAALAPWKGEA